MVKVSSLDESYYAQQFTGGRRFDAGAPVEAVAQQPAAAAPVAAAAAVAPAAPATPAVDPTEVAKAQAKVARDAAEVRRSDSQLFLAVVKQEKTKDLHHSAMFLKAIHPSQVEPPADGGGRRRAAARRRAGAGRLGGRRAAAGSRHAAGQRPRPTCSPRPPVDLSGAAAEYPGNDATQAELAKWLAGQAQKAGLPPELPVMASLVESGVKNLNFGDRD